MSEEDSFASCHALRISERCNGVKNIQDVYHDRAPALRTVKKWFAKFSLGDFQLDDEPRSGRPSLIDDDVVVNLLQNSPRISTEEVAEELTVDRSTAFRRIKKLGYNLKLDAWVSHWLTEANQLNRISAAISLLGRLDKEPFLSRLVTGDEKWILYNNFQRKRTWKMSNERSDPMAKSNLHPEKVMLSVWWDWQGILYFELLPVGQIIHSDKYCQQLENLKAAIEEKRRILANREGVIFKTLQKLRELTWDVLLHPLYSSDIAPSDYHLFWSLQNYLDGKMQWYYGWEQREISS
ncbi:PREDICTED: histone-lysine N-methyltransferase SETMAR-like [Habropoda laboriosa]|uniref:histone-lysine N-methyltransferase SETMAR-like n=1 Tax=Habropoda laboriosa TaxID=597456 RepID=UPI00083CA9DB|nr:PREDICTED: histone-lysine N-methyltransferase SETMAR-like [Habropoda laboriosa]